MGVVVISPVKQIRVSYRIAQKRLQKLIEKGERLTLVARRSQDPVDAVVAPWYSAYIETLRGIYPSTEEMDLIHRAYTAMETWPAKIQAVVDQLDNLRTTMKEAQQPPAPSRLVDWLK